MGKGKAPRTADKDGPVIHGADDLPTMTVASYNLELRNKDGFIGDRANKSAFRDSIETWRKRARKGGEDPLGELETDALSKKEIDRLLANQETEAATLLQAAVDDFAAELSSILMRYLEEDTWAGVERIAVGGGFRDSKAGLMAIARTQLLLKAEGKKVSLLPIAYHPDEAGLIGAVHLIRPLTDQNPLAHSLRPIDMTRHGWLSSRRQASQQ